jgi:hypothetical protein
MSRFKLLAFIALITFALGVALVGNAFAGERGKIAMREAFYGTAFHPLKLPDVEDHSIFVYEGKGIAFYEKWGACLVTETGTFDVLKGEGPGQGYSHYTFPDGSTITEKFEGKYGASGGKGPYTTIKGTGKLEGIQGEGTWKSYNLSPDRFYSDEEGEYTLP